MVESHEARLLQELKTCVSDCDVARMKELVAEFRKTNPNQHRPYIYRLAFRCYFNASKGSEALAFFRAIVAQGYTPEIEDIEVIIHGLLRLSDEANARIIFDSLSNYKLRARPTTFNKWISFYLRDHQPEKARSVFREMEGNGLKPNQTTFLSFLVYFIEKGDFKSAEQIRQYMASKRISVDTIFYNGLIAALGKRHAFTELEAILQEMDKEKVKYNEDTYNQLIKLYARFNRHDRIHELLQQMRQRGIQPSTLTFNLMLRSFSHSITPDQTRELLVQMSHMGLNFNCYTFAAIIANLLKQNKQAEAVEMLFELEKKKTVLAVDSYHDLLKICSDNKLEGAFRVIWNQMRKFEVPPTNQIYSLLTRYFLQKRNYALVDGLLLEMKRKWGLSPNPFIFATLLNHYVECLDITRIRSLIAAARELDVEINSVMYNVIMKCFFLYSRYHHGGQISRVKGLDLDALSNVPTIDNADIPIFFDPSEDMTPLDINRLKMQFEKLFSLEFRPTIHVYNELMLSFFVRELFDEMFACLQEMRQYDVTPNQTTYTFLIKARIYQGDLGRAKLLFKEMTSLGMKPTLLHCALFFHSYCRKLMTEDAEAFLTEIEQVFQIKPNHVFFGSLIYAYTRRREYSLVFQAFERMERAGFQPDTETCNYVLIALLEINEFREARQFFEKMLLQGIPRNSHTYSYLSDGFLARNDDASLLTILSDCTASGNMIDSYPFNRVMNTYYRSGRTDEILKVLLLMEDYCVQYGRETVSFVNLMLHHCKDDPDALPKLTRVVKKTLVDLAQDIPYLPANLSEQLIDALERAKLDTIRADFVAFLDDLPELRRLWTTLDPSILQQFTEQLIINNPEMRIGKIICNESVDSIRDQLQRMWPTESPSEQMLNLVKRE